MAINLNWQPGQEIKYDVTAGKLSPTGGWETQPIVNLSLGGQQQQYQFDTPEEYAQFFSQLGGIPGGQAAKDLTTQFATLGTKQGTDTWWQWMAQDPNARAGQIPLDFAGATGAFVAPGTAPSPGDVRPSAGAPSDFPPAPANGQTYTDKAGKTWTWKGDRWTTPTGEMYGGAAGTTGTTPPSAAPSTQPPANAQPGQIWQDASGTNWTSTGSQWKSGQNIYGQQPAQQVVQPQMQQPMQQAAQPMQQGGQQMAQQPQGDFWQRLANEGVTDASGNQLISPEQTQATLQQYGVQVAAKNNLDNVSKDTGVSIPEQEAVMTNPYKTIGDLLSQVMASMGWNENNDTIGTVNKEVEALQNERDEKIRRENDDPWLEEGVRRARVAKINEEYSDKLANKVDYLQLLQTQNNDIKQQAQWVMGQTLDLYQMQAQFDQQMRMNLLTDAQDKAKLYTQQEFEWNKMLAQSDLNLRNQMDILKYKDTMTEQEKQVLTEQQKGTLLEERKVIQGLVDSDKLGQVTGARNIATWFPGTEAQGLLANLNQVRDFVSLQNRQTLKGSGTISDYEMRILSSASTILANEKLGEEDVRKELIRINAAMGMAAGVAVKALLVDPKTGESAERMITREDANSALSDGLIIDYLK